jgi:hypothetical protein
MMMMMMMMIVMVMKRRRRRKRRSRKSRKRRRQRSNIWRSRGMWGRRSKMKNNKFVSIFLILNSCGNF